MRHNNYGLLLETLQRYKEAEQAYLNAINLRDLAETWRSYALLSLLYKEMGQDKEFREYYIIAAEHNPDIRDAEFEKQEGIVRPTETLILSDFGPIRHIEIELKKFTLLIGKQGQGKSTIAKMIAILGNLKQFLAKAGTPPTQAELLKKLADELAEYGLSAYLKPQSVLRWQYAAWYIEYKQGTISSSNNKIALFDRPVHYIPAERAFTVLAAGAFQNLLLNQVPISPTLLRFGATFEKARARFSQQSIPFLGISYNLVNGIDYITTPKPDLPEQEKNAEFTIPLRESASSHQAVVPMYLTMAYLREQNPQTLFVVEEPELNLFPVAQKQMIEYIVRTCLHAKTNNQVIVTTHSPYVLTSLNNLLQAMTAYLRNPQEGAEIEKIVPTELWLLLSEISAYLLDEGQAKNILDKEIRLITDNAIDSVSDEIAEAFSLLTDIKYANQSDE